MYKVHVKETDIKQSELFKIKLSNEIMLLA